MWTLTYKFIFLHPIHKKFLAILRCKYWTCRATEKCNWQTDFLNTSVNEKVVTFNNTVINILSNFIPHYIIVCDDKNPPWLNNKIKTLVQTKYAAFNGFRKNSGNSELKRHLVILQECVKASIGSSKQKYYYRIVNKSNST